MVNFEEHMKGVLAITGRRLTALAKTSNILNFSKFRLLIKSFVDSQFSYCPLVWMLCSRTLNNKFNKHQERSLRILYNDDISTFTQLLEKDNSITVHDRNIKLLAKEMFKVHNNILPNALGDLVTKRIMIYDLRNPSTYLRDKSSTTSYGTESLRILGPKIWDLLPSDIKSADNLQSFQTKIKNWNCENCPCRLCKVLIGGLGFI